MMDVSVIMKFVKEKPHSCNRMDKLAMPKKMRRLWERTSCKELFRKKEEGWLEGETKAS